MQPKVQLNFDIKWTNYVKVLAINNIFEVDRGRR